MPEHKISDTLMAANTRKKFPYRNRRSCPPKNKNRTHQGPVIAPESTTLPIFPILRAYSLPSDNAPTATALPCAFFPTLAAIDSVDNRTLLNAARRSLLVDLTTLADH